jgi:hypothetical protein
MTLSDAIFDPTNAPGQIDLRDCAQLQDGYDAFTG